MELAVKHENQSLDNKLVKLITKSSKKGRKSRSRFRERTHPDRQPRIKTNTEEFQRERSVSPNVVFLRSHTHSIEKKTAAVRLQTSHASNYDEHFNFIGFPSPRKDAEKGRTETAQNEAISYSAVLQENRVQQKINEPPPPETNKNGINLPDHSNAAQFGLVGLSSNTGIKSQKCLFQEDLPSVGGQAYENDVLCIELEDENFLAAEVDFKNPATEDQRKQPTQASLTPQISIPGSSTEEFHDARAESMSTSTDVAQDQKSNAFELSLSDFDEEMPTDKGYKTIALTDTSDYYGDLEIAAVFGLNCLNFLTGNCWDASHDHQFAPMSRIKTQLQCMTVSNLFKSYRFAYRNKFILQKFFHLFCDIYANKRNVKQLLCMAVQLQKYEEETNLLKEVFRALIKTGMKSNEAWLLLYHNRRKDSLAVIDVLLDIAVNLDWTLFIEAIDEISQRQDYLIHINLLQRMALKMDDKPTEQIYAIFIRAVSKHNAECRLPPAIVNFLSKMADPI